MDAMTFALVYLLSHIHLANSFSTGELATIIENKIVGNDGLNLLKSENTWNISRRFSLIAKENSISNEDVFKETNSDISDNNNLGSHNVSMADVNWNSIMGFLKMETQSVIQSLNLTDLIKIVNISDECRGSLQRFFMSLSEWEAWAVMMADASAKIPGGVLDGTTLDLGSFEECLKIRVHSDDDEVEQFRGRYCLVGYKSPLLSRFNQEPFLTHREKYIETYGEPPEWIEEFIRKSGKYIKIVSMYLGTCVPSTCSKEDVIEIATHVVRPLGLEVHIPSCQVDEPKPFIINGLISLCFIGVLITLCIIGTITDIVGRYVLEDQQSLKSKCFLLYLLRLFSLYLNAEKFFGEHKGSSTLSFFNGIRFISCIWIILEHSWISRSEWRMLSFRNFLAMDDTANDTTTSFLLGNGDAATETFLYISGFLLVYTTWQKLETSKGKLNIFKYMAKKYWRLTPVLCVTMAIFLVYDHYGSGPIFEASETSMITACYTHWYWNFLYINNWWSTENMCLTQTWFLAVLMQLHLVGVILLIITYRMPNVGIIIGSAMVVTSSIYLALVIILNSFPLPAYFGLTNADYRVYFNETIHFKTYTHVNAYIIGMTTGYLVLKYKDKNIKLKYQALGWIVALCLFLLVVEGRRLAGDSTAAVAFYSSVHRTAWSLSLGWITYICATGHGGVINRFLSWHGFTNVSNISYLAYLLHFLFICSMTSTMRERLEYRKIQEVYRFLVIAVVSYLISAIAYLTVEMPFSAIGDLIFRR